MMNSNGITLLNVRLKSTEKKITNVEDVICIMHVSYHVKGNNILLLFHSTCVEVDNKIFDMESEYKCPVEDYDDEKEMVMNLVESVSSKVEELVAMFTSQMTVDA